MNPFSLPSSLPSKSEGLLNGMTVYREREDFRLGHHELRGKKSYESIDILEAQKSLLWMNFERVTKLRLARQAGTRSPL